MKPFEVDLSISTVTSSYPEAKALVKVAVEGGDFSKEAIARLWLSEGIPYAFRELPALYEVVRSWLGENLNIHPKEISIIGSARTGQSIAPKKLGKCFGPHSDMDFFVVSSDLFNRMKADFEQWKIDIDDGIEIPENHRQKDLWEENLKVTPKNISREFINSWMIPSREKYSTIQNINDLMWRLKEKLDVTPKAPRIKKASIRCYRNWNSYIKQSKINLSQFKQK